jgi:hypothetical protein
MSVELITDKQNIFCQSRINMKRKHTEAFSAKDVTRKNNRNESSNSVPTASELQRYLSNHNVEPLFVSIMESLCIDRPKDIPAYIIHYLEKNFVRYHDKNIIEKPKRTGGNSNGTPSSRSSFSFGSDTSEDQEDQPMVEDAQAEKDAVSNYRMQARRSSDGGDDKEDAPVSDVISENIRRRYSIGGRRVGISNEPLDETMQSPVMVQKSEEDLRHIELAITQCPMLSHLDSDDKITISRAMFPQSFDQGTLIIKQGDEGSHFYVIDSGECEVHVDGELKKVLEVIFKINFANEIAR